MSDIEVRRATSDDLDAVLLLIEAAMGRSEDPRFAELFRWKHLENAFGPSPAWVAVDDGRVIAVRYLMRWEFEQGTRHYTAVRAVDTATHPDYQGKGLFSRLTRVAVAELESEGIDFVFNTPNDQSRPGYLKMGWQMVGVLPVPIRPVSLRGAVRMVRSKVVAEHFSIPTLSAQSARDVLVNDAELAELLAGRVAPDRLRTRLDPSVLSWRYGGELISYRAVRDRNGLIVFRLRRRGVARELAIALVLVTDRRNARSNLLRAAFRAARGEFDYAIGIGDRPGRTFLSLPGIGPTLTWRALHNNEFRPINEWSLTLGDIEPF